MNPFCLTLVIGSLLMSQALPAAPPADPYLGLEEVTGAKAMAWVEALRVP